MNRLLHFVNGKLEGKLLRVAFNIFLVLLLTMYSLVFFGAFLVLFLTGIGFLPNYGEGSIIFVLFFGVSGGLFTLISTAVSLSRTQKALTAYPVWLSLVYLVLTAAWGLIYFSFERFAHL